ncbi:MAG: DUF488 domain-containing protein [Dehalococcoidia bacterium]
MRDADFFTFGYTGRPTEEVLDLLKAAGVATVVDIRFSPVSMYKPDFSKSNLCRIVEKHGLSYIHLPQLGVPKNIRTLAAERGTREVIWDWYDEHVVTRYIGHNLHFFLNFADHPMALMCVEIDPGACHRHLLFQALEDHGLRGFDL